MFLMPLDSMAGLVDNESIENNGVSAGDREIQDSVNDDGLRERVSTEPFISARLMAWRR